MNFKDFKVNSINDYDAKSYNIHFSYFIGDENRSGSIYIEPEEVRIYADFKNSPEEVIARDDFRLLPNGEVEVIKYPNDSFIIGDTLALEQEEFLKFLKKNGVPTTPEEGENWYWKLYHNLVYFGDYNKSSL